MAPRKSPLFDTATTVGKIMSFLGVSALCGILAAGLIFPLAATGGAAASTGSDILDDIPVELQEEPLSTPARIYANDGETLIATMFMENREPVSLDEISQPMKDAIVAIEDERFYEHGGVDAQGVGRALVHNLTRPTQQGASTLTMQYVNNILNNAAIVRGEGRVLASGLEEKTYADKLREMKLAVSLEQEMTKDEILEGYLNIVMLGGQNYGVEAAAQYYWGVSAAELDVQQSATLAGIVQAPNQYRPDVEENLEASEYRRNVVLNTMLRNGYITQEEYDEAIAVDLGETLENNSLDPGCMAAGNNVAGSSYFCDYVVTELTADTEFGQQFGEDEDSRFEFIARGGFDIVTTLDPELQEAAHEEVMETTPIGTTVTNSSGEEEAVVSVLNTQEPGTGNILSMAQSTDWVPETDDPSETTQNLNVGFNHRGGEGFNTGSLLKPFVAAAWIEEGGSMDDLVDASRDHYPDGSTWEASCVDGGQIRLNEPGGWDVFNVAEDAERDMSVDFGLYYSINTATVATAYDMDLCAITDVADRLQLQSEGGITLQDQIGQPSFLLGSLEMTPLTMSTAYATFANDGELCQPRVVESVVDGQGTEYEPQPVDCEQVIDPDVVAQVNDTMINIAEEQAAGGNPPFPMAGKTGTHHNGAHTWFQGFTEGLATSAFVGRYQSNETLWGETFAGEYHEEFFGSTLAMPMWYDYMSRVGDNYATGDFREADDSPFDNRRSWRYSWSDLPSAGSNNSDDDDNGDDDDDD